MGDWMPTLTTPTFTQPTRSKMNNGPLQPSSFDGCLSPSSQTPSVHNFVNDLGSGNLSSFRLEIPQPCSICLRRGQPGRVALRHGCFLALSVRTQRGTSRPDCWGVAFYV